MTFCIFPLSRTNFSVPFRPPLKQQCGAKWICNLFKQLSLPFWESTFYLPLPQMSQSNVQMLPIQTNAGQICYNATKWMWMRDTWIIKLPKHISAQKVGYCDTSGLLKFWWPNPTWGWRHNGRGKSVDARACAGVGHRRQPCHLLWRNILFYVARKHWWSLLFSRPKNWRRKYVNCNDKILQQMRVNHGHLTNFVIKLNLQ